MDRDAPDVDDPSRDAGDAPSAAERLFAGLTELRTRLEAAEPDDRLRSRDAVELIRQAQQRIVALEEMLAWAREREEELTTRVVRAEIRSAELESTLAELHSMVVGKVSEAVEARLQAETDAVELQQLLAASRSDLEANQLESRRLSARCSDLEADLAAIGDELASSKLAEVRAQRLERQRDLALERARTESRIALEARLRAADAERQLLTLRDRVRVMGQRLTGSATRHDTPGRVPDSPSDMPSPAEPTAPEPIIDVATRMETERGDSLDLTEDESTAEDEIVDLTHEWNDSTDDAVAAGYEVDEAVVWGSPEKRGGLVAWLLGGSGPEGTSDEDSHDVGRE